MLDIFVNNVQSSHDKNTGCIGSQRHIGIIGVFDIDCLTVRSRTFDANIISTVLAVELFKRNTGKGSIIVLPVLNIYRCFRSVQFADSIKDFTLRSGVVLRDGGSTVIRIFQTAAIAEGFIILLIFTGLIVVLHEL